MRIATFDIEAHDLSPEFAPLLCLSVLSHPSDEMTTFRQDDYVKRGLAEDMTDDRQLCVDARDFLESHHILVSYFGKGFDMSLLRTRLVKHGERPLKEMPHLDAIWGYRGWRGLKPMSSKMKHVAKFFGFEEKPEVGPDVWLKARAGNKKAMDEIVERCEADVRITHRLAEKALELNLLKNITRY